ncbi:retinol-binding protein pinta-like [Anthonomus grandis grandis]|uniref:retinol-binding protein pinta-like n=1 Tax=Anthonomus grandis grandis TaxID=2921223 RepID=UPI0021663418|nr:retinol-binding protein pinta-like [Anthonomus grandis grandis]
MPSYWEVNEENFYNQVYKEMGKTKSEIFEYVEILKKWASEQPHFPEVPPENGLLFSIVACKFSIEKAKRKIDMYYTIRNLMPDIYQEHPFSPKMQKAQQVCYFFPLPKPSKEAHRVVYCKFDPRYKPEDFHHEDFVIQLIQIIEIYLQEDKSFYFSLIIDCEPVKLGHISRFNPMIIKKLGTCVEKVYANRVAAVYLINFYASLETLVNTVFKPFLPKLVADRMHIMNGTEGLFKIYDKSILPKDIGGEEKSLDELREGWIEKLREWKPRFDKIQYMKVDESKRPSKLENDDVLGYYGSFRQIGVD